MFVILQEPTVNHSLEKENPWSAKAITVSKPPREPLSTTSNTVHLHSKTKSPKKPGYYYNDYDESFTRILPLRNQAMSDYYQPLETAYGPPRPGSADQIDR